MKVKELITFLQKENPEHEVNMAYETCACAEIEAVEKGTGDTVFLCDSSSSEKR